MKLSKTWIVAALSFYLASSGGVLFAQQGAAKRNFEAEINKAIESAKTAAGFEFLGTLVRTCLLPQSGGENLTDIVPAYVSDPAKAPPRDTWFAEPAKVFETIYISSAANCIHHGL